MRTFTLRIEDGKPSIRPGIYLKMFETVFGRRYGIDVGSGKAIEVLNGNIGMVNHIFPTKMENIYSTIPIDDEAMVNPYDIMVRIPNQVPWGPECSLHRCSSLCGDSLGHLFILHHNQEAEVIWQNTLRLRFTTSRKSGICIINETRLGNDEEEYW